MNVPDDASNGWDAVADEFIARRAESAIGLGTVRQWASELPAGSAILDLGCGSGAPNAVALVEDGFTLYGVDASPRLVAAFRARLPDAHVACEAVEISDFFGRQFDAVIAIGLLFLLDAEAQCELLLRVSQALKPGGRLLFTAPAQHATWKDLLTGRVSVSLGQDGYEAILAECGLLLIDGFVDEGGNHYYAAANSAYASVRK
jgi:SAM-dependent methyltransferase